MVCEPSSGIVLSMSSITVMVPNPSPSPSAPNWVPMRLLLLLTTFVAPPANLLPARPVPRGIPVTPFTVGTTPFAFGIATAPLGVRNPIGLANGT
ncbi:hypothetical protein MLD38_018146 [Melastoma candidum]|uniref:Uncharacterized protein n=1 Tax=Melastoma candidum TaxID=119954 RepID=A0ACB9QSC2_9MYRT|nr:hypothetical protein MLD38_018146 [Melastoma candidum]